MISATEIVNDNSISAIALSFFTVIVGGIVTIIVQSIKSKQSAREAAVKANEAAKKAEAARANTVNVSNGFAGGVDRKLDHIVTALSGMRTAIDDTQKSLTDHLQYHLEREKK